MSTPVLFWLATTGRVVRGRLGGSLSSTDWQWANTEDWLGPGPLAPADPHESAVALARRYLHAFGPATFDDHRVDDELVATEADAVAQWLGDLRFTPRFVTPWQAELVEG